MTPITHAAVGTAIYRQLRKRNWGSWGFLLALALAVLSHYALDSIPHFEGVVEITEYKQNLALIVGIGTLGIVLSAALMRWNRELARIWMVLFLWVAMGSYSFSWLRILTAVAALAFVTWSSKRLAAPAYLLVGMVAIAPDLIPSKFKQLADLHKSFHYHTDLGTLLHVFLPGSPVPTSWSGRLHDPYFLVGFALEMLIEGGIFLMALYFSSQERFEPEGRGAPETVSQLTGPAAVSGKSAGPLG